MQVCEASEAPNWASEIRSAASELQILPDGALEAPLQEKLRNPIVNATFFSMKFDWFRDISKNL